MVEIKVQVTGSVVQLFKERTTLIQVYKWYWWEGNRGEGTSTGADEDRRADGK